MYKRLARMFHTSSDSQRAVVINTLLQRGVLCQSLTQKRFNGFYAVLKTAQAVRPPSQHTYTPLKQGGNERSDTHFEGESDL